MTTLAITNSFSLAKERYYLWRDEAIWFKRLALALGMAALTGLAAQVSIPVPGSPVPITGQTFAVLLSGVALGRRWGGVSQALYVVIGAAGLPWFSAGRGGVGMLTGATGGYLAGFVLASLFVGWMIDRHPRLRGLFAMIGLMTFTSIFLIHLPGLIGLSAWLSATTGKAPTLNHLLTVGFYPFVIGDILKTMLAASAARLIAPK